MKRSTAPRFKIGITPVTDIWKVGNLDMRDDSCSSVTPPTEHVRDTKWHVHATISIVLDTQYTVPEAVTGSAWRYKEEFVRFRDSENQNLNHPLLLYVLWD